MSSVPPAAIGRRERRAHAAQALVGGRLLRTASFALVIASRSCSPPVTAARRASSAVRSRPRRPGGRPCRRRPRRAGGPRRRRSRPRSCPDPADIGGRSRDEAEAHRGSPRRSGRTAPGRPGAGALSSTGSPFTNVPLREPEILDVDVVAAPEQARVHLRDERVVVEHDAAPAAAADRDLVVQRVHLALARRRLEQPHAGARGPRRRGAAGGRGVAPRRAGRLRSAHLRRHDPHDARTGTGTASARKQNLRMVSRLGHGAPRYDASNRDGGADPDPVAVEQHAVLHAVDQGPVEDPRSTRR